MNNAPIGIFDSGLGGLTVARAIIDQLPHESINYIGDTKNSPYGPRPIAQVRSLALEVMDKLVDSGVKMLVIACNSASSAVLRDARERYTQKAGIPIAEVIQPAVRHAVVTTRNGKIGVIGTQTTIRSGAYADSFAAAPNLELTMAACPRFVEFVEKGSGYAGARMYPLSLAIRSDFLCDGRRSGARIFCRRDGKRCISTAFSTKYDGGLHPKASA